MKGYIMLDEPLCTCLAGQWLHLCRSFSLWPKPMAKDPAQACEGCSPESNYWAGSGLIALGRID